MADNNYEYVSDTMARNIKIVLFILSPITVPVGILCLAYLASAIALFAPQLMAFGNAFVWLNGMFDYTSVVSIVLSGLGALCLCLAPLIPVGIGSLVSSLVWEGDPMSLFFSPLNVLWAIVFWCAFALVWNVSTGALPLS